MTSRIVITEQAQAILGVEESSTRIKYLKKRIDEKIDDLKGARQLLKEATRPSYPGAAVSYVIYPHDDGGLEIFIGRPCEVKRCKMLNL